MRRLCLSSLIALACSALAGPALAEAQPMQLASHPVIHPDGERIAFTWNGDIWSAPIAGGAATRLTQHPSEEARPFYSPDGRELAFLSRREGSWQVFVMPAEGGIPEQLTFHSEGSSLYGWHPDGARLLTRGARDAFWRHAERFFLIDRAPRSGERPLFDAAGHSGSLSPDGRKLLFCREGESWWRKGYEGPRASQVWLYDIEAARFEPILRGPQPSRSPIWKPDGSGFLFVGARGGALNLREYDFATKQQRALTSFEDDSVVSPCISADGRSAVFRHLFDLYRLDLTRPSLPRRIRLELATDAAPETELKRVLGRADAVAFSDDGLEMAFVAGGDIWVMDRELREPVQVTDTAEEEREPVFSRDGASLYFVSDRGGRSDIAVARCAEPEKAWWQNRRFEIKDLTSDAELESGLSLSPDGKTLAYTRGRGDLMTRELEGGATRCILKSWNRVDLDWSPDGRWLVIAVDDDDFNRDVWILQSDGQGERFNLSRHPDDDRGPVWSPDGRVIAWTGRRMEDERDIYFVYLRQEDHRQTPRERKLAEAIAAMEKVRKPKDKGKDKEKDAKEEAVRIDFEGIHERIRRVAIPEASEGGLIWSPDSKRLAFAASIRGDSATWTVSPPDDLRPRKLSDATGSGGRWLETGNQLVWLTGGQPASVNAKTGGQATFGLRALQRLDLGARHLAAFEQCWRAMRDNFYDDQLNGRNWSAIRRKYQDAARQAPDLGALREVVSLMLGELNGSHLGFSTAGEANPTGQQWYEVTAHLGARFDTGYAGPGWRVADIIPDGPADKPESRLEVGDVILQVDGVEVDPAMDATRVLNGVLDRDITLSLRRGEAELELALRPMSFGAARAKLYEAWVDRNRRAVDAASKGALGYIHVRAMNWPSFLAFEEELYAAGAGRDGLVIDVRENGGGFTADHLLTALTQPRHAITVPRGGGPGYPQGRRVYATWHKPIIVLCNQNSFSNAEIFSHAIKTLGRGRLVGVQTAGGVISTGATRILDVGVLRMPFRGWYVLPTGEDMELNGAKPDLELWPEPGDWPAGRDSQLDLAVATLLEEVRAWRARPRPPLRKASERR